TARPFSRAPDDGSRGAAGARCRRARSPSAAYPWGHVDDLTPPRYGTAHGPRDRAPSEDRSVGVTQTPLTLRRWQRAEYERLVGLGVFRGEPLELIGGELVVAEPQGAYHAAAITRVDYAL